MDFRLHEAIHDQRGWEQADEKNEWITPALQYVLHRTILGMSLEGHLWDQAPAIHSGHQVAEQILFPVSFLSY